MITAKMPHFAALAAPLWPLRQKLQLLRAAVVPFRYTSGNVSLITEVDSYLYLCYLYVKLFTDAVLAIASALP
jgi:hypothetical protein